MVSTKTVLKRDLLLPIPNLPNAVASPGCSIYRGVLSSDGGNCRSGKMKITVTLAIKIQNEDVGVCTFQWVAWRKLAAAILSILVYDEGPTYHAKSKAQATD